MSDEVEHREKTCPDCRATDENMDVRIIAAGTDLETGVRFTSTTWHAKDCPQYLVDQILTEESVRQAKEDTARMKAAFPVAYERLNESASAADISPSAAPFVAVLLELVGRQAQDLDRFVSPERWLEILEKHFPPEEEPSP